MVSDLPSLAKICCSTPPSPSQHQQQFSSNQISTVSDRLPKPFSSFNTPFEQVAASPSSEPCIEQKPEVSQLKVAPLSCEISTAQHLAEACYQKHLAGPRTTSFQKEVPVWLLQLLNCYPVLFMLE
ncbi:hypothetical protein GOBAR_DD33000 [Gossypium barbadense]|nr:hypothetical protein GOBAR_DD33000 [Gossypium barbadense]